LLVGKKFKATSPNGRFADGAAAIDGQPFQRIEAVGKNLFAFFGTAKGTLAVVHIHFGMAGVWSVFDSTQETVPPTTSTTRLCLEHPETGLVSHLSAMTVQLGDEDFYAKKKATLGQDPLRDDSDADLLYEKIRVSKKKIGELVMDQSYFCGPGNIYRAEILFKAGVHPNIPGMQVSRESFDRIWHHTVELLRRGYECGSILTVDPEEAAALGKPSLRRYIYNAATCGRCGTRVQSWEMATRTCYACPSCQPAGATAVAADARDVQVFVSHCAREPLEARLAQGAEKLVVRELQAELLARGLPATGKKSDLVLRLNSVLVESGGGRTEITGAAVVGAKPADSIKMKLSATQAAAEKAQAGESRAVEHIAELHPTQAAAAAAAAAASPGRAAAGKRGDDKRAGKTAPGQLTGATGSRKRKAEMSVDVKKETEVAPSIMEGLGGRQTRPRGARKK
jgi:formamidopyrimidine-DNA glycosylase